MNRIYADVESGSRLQSKVSIDLRFHQRSSYSSAVTIKAQLTFCVLFNTVAAGANVIFSFFDNSINDCNVVGTPVSGFGPSGEGYFRLSAFGHRKNVIEAVERIKKNLK